MMRWSERNHEAYKARVAGSAAPSPKLSLAREPRPGTAKYPVFESLLRQRGLGPFRTEFMFHPERMFRADYAWPESHLLVECVGGAFVQGRHNRGRGFLDDMLRRNAAQMLGFRVLEYPPEKLTDAVDEIARALGR
jgi:hypothetical protein